MLRTSYGGGNEFVVRVLQELKSQPGLGNILQLKAAPVQ